jgi:hypothetical protein
MPDAREVNDATEIRPGGTVPAPRAAGAPFDIGHKLNDRYVIADRVGAGGFGYVFRARDELLGRDVALKTLNSRRGSAEEDHLLDEARTIARLDHPHIVPIYDVGVADGVTWMAMKLIDGTSLDRVLALEGQVDRDRALAIAEQAALALDHAHRRGIIHRDVKPSNILLSRRDDGAEHAWLADFGIAKILTGKTTTGESLIAGTPSYMAPEQITGKRVDARTDIFALGCVTAEMLTGRRPFPGATLTELTYKIVHEPPEGVSDIGAIAGPAIETTVRRSLAKSPEDRFQTAEEFRRHLLQRSVAPRVSLLRRWRARATATAWDGRDVIVCSNLWKGYGWRSKVVRGADLTVPRGAIYALLGRNGSGKTTLIRTLIGLYRRDDGIVRVFGRDPQHEAAAILPRVGFVPESLPVYETLRVGELLHLMAEIYADWDPSFAYSLLGKFRLPLEKKIGTLSREVTVTFDDDAPSALSSIADFKTIRSSGRHVTGFVMDESSGAIEQVKALRPASINTRELTLKEIFVNFMRET